MIRRTGGLALPLLILAGCGSNEPEPAPTPTMTSTEASGPRTLVPTNLALDELGPHIVGPDGTQFESDIVIDGRTVGTVTSFVTCPAEKEAETCDPAVQPEGTVYTYVHHIALADAEEDSSAEPVFATMFRTARPVPGFANVIGFDEDEAARTLGEGGDVKVQVDNGALIWRIAAGDGWAPGESLTFYWRSTLPPGEPGDDYQLELGGESGSASGPFPLAESPVDETEAN